MAPGLTARGLVAGLFAALVACAPAGARHAERSATASTPPVRATTMTESPSGGVIGRTALVQLGDHFYSPAELTVRVGTTVMYFCVPHYGDGMYSAIIVLPANGG